MTGSSHLTIHTGVAIVIAAALVITGAVTSYIVTRESTSAGEEPAATPTRATVEATAESRADDTRTLATSAPLPDIVVSLSPEDVKRAGIVVVSVLSSESSTNIRLPGVVEPNAYKQVVVTPLVAGRITSVAAQLGDRVRRGHILAQLYSPQLAEAQTKYVSAKAMLDAHERELQRTQKLVEIGAASRQELERIHAEHAAQTATVQSARSQLELLGMARADIDALVSGTNVNATTSVPAPIDGVITTRTVNIGLNVEPGSSLFTVVDLSTVWIVADVFERDLARIRVGSEAIVTSDAYGGLSMSGRVGYIDPQVSSETRTVKIRVEVPNPRGELRLGMYADVQVGGLQGEAALVIPRIAVQNVGDRTVVYLADTKKPGAFLEREIRLGNTSGQRVQVVSGLRAGDVIVSEGSFFVRAEGERLGLRSVSPAHQH